MNFQITSSIFFANFATICAETSLVIDNQENVGTKREKRMYGTAQEKAAGSHLKKNTFGTKYDAGHEIL